MRSGKPLTPLLSGVCLILLLFLSSAWLAFNQDVNKSQIKFLVNQSRRSLAYKVSDQNAALFKISPREDHIELITNLDLNQKTYERAIDETTEDQEAADAEWEYGIEVKFLDNNLNEISREVYWEKSRQSEWLDETTGNPMKAAFYLYESLRVTDSRITTINMPEPSEQERYIAVSLVSPEACSASVRVYRHVDLSVDGEAKGLRPMPRRLRAKLARHNLYHDKIRSVELQRSMTDVLSQIPAETRSGYQYETRQLFLFDQSLPTQGEEPPGSPFADNLKSPAWFPITGPAILTVKVGERSDVETTVWLDDQLLSESVRSPDKNRKIKFDLGPGNHLLKLSSDSENQRIIYTRISPEDAWTGSSQQVDDILPVDLMAYYTISDQDQDAPVILELPTAPDHGNRIIKILCRIPVCDTMENQSHGQFTYQYFDENDSILDSGSVEWDAEKSPLARYYNSTEKKCDLSMPQRWFLCPPDNATRMELTSTTSLEAAFFTRLTSIDETVKVSGPAGTSDGQSNAPVRYKNDSIDTIQYFYFRPSNSDILATSDRKSWICLPEGILEPLVDMESQEEILYASSLYPSNSNTAWKTIFEPVAERVDDNLTYIRLSNNEPMNLQVVKAQAARTGVHYRLDEKSLPVITVSVDNIQISQFRPVTFNGYFELPILESGEHTVEISSNSNNNQFFIKLPANVVSDGTFYRKRKVFTLNPNSRMIVPVNQKVLATHGLNIIAYQNSRASEPVDIVAHTDTGQLPSDQALECLTHNHRQFQGTDDFDISASVYCSSGQTLKPGQRFFFALHDDLQQDHYTITIQSNNDEPVYLRFFAMTPEDRLDA